MRPITKKAKKSPSPIEWKYQVNSPGLWHLYVGPEWFKARAVVEYALSGKDFSWKFGFPNEHTLASGTCQTLKEAQRDALDAALTHVKTVISAHREVLGSIQATRKALKDAP